LASGIMPEMLAGHAYGNGPGFHKRGPIRG
jgi:hypothetical protein